MTADCYGRDGQPITLDQWAELRRDVDNIIVARTEIGPHVTVSTVWLGVDHGWGDDPDRPPIIFETMVFGGPMAEEQWRYATEAQAVEGHGVVVSLVRRAMSNRRWGR